MLTEIMESVTLVLSGTVLALQCIGSRDKYLWPFLPDRARTVMLNMVGCYVEKKNTNYCAVSLSVRFPNTVPLFRSFHLKWLLKTFENKRKDSPKGRQRNKSGGATSQILHPRMNKNRFVSNEIESREFTGKRNFYKHSKNSFLSRSQNKYNSLDGIL